MNQNVPIRVLLVDGSALSQTVIKRLLAPYTDIEVVGSARDGRAGLKCVETLDPQVICTDLFMPVMDGLAFTKAVMEHHARPILVLSSALEMDQPFTVFDLLVAGAMDLFYKPEILEVSNQVELSKSLAAKIRELAKLVCRPDVPLQCETTLPTETIPVVNMVVVGGGLGAPQVLREILAGLNADFPLPILAILHLDEPFFRPLLRWLDAQTGLLVQEGSHGEMPMAGSVYLPPPGYHLLLDGQGSLALSQVTLQDLCCPSISVTMESVAHYFGGAVIGILLTGLGRDGLRGIAAIAQAGGTTLVQDDTSSIAFDTPWQAIELGAATYVLPCAVMADALLNLTGKSEIDHCLSLPLAAVDQHTLVQRDNQNILLLIVEDSPIQAFKLRRFLLASGFDVAVANDGQEGVEMASTLRPKLIISDVSMPKMNGFQLCQAIKNDPQLQTIPVMLLTALTNPEEILEGLASGANNYLVKPWEESHLLGMIQHALSRVGIDEQTEQSLEIVFNEKTYAISSGRRQILDLLLTTYQKAVRQNKALVDSQLEMKLLTLQLVEQYAKETTLNKQLQQEMVERLAMEAEQSRTLRELEEANRELDDFAYIIAHDLKTPLRGIGSLTNWLIADFVSALSAEGADLVRLLASRAERINLLIEALLQYTRVTRLNEVLTQVDLNKVVNHVIKELVIPEEMEILIDAPLPKIYFQESRAVQIFHHLIGNAVRYAEQTVGVVRIGVIDAGRYWQFWVQDNGAGIEPHYFDKIFGVFQTLQPRDEVETAGIGLALVRKIVEKYGGRIWVESQLGVGSTFSFTLPKKVDSLLMVQGRKDRRS